MKVCAAGQTWDFDFEKISNVDVMALEGRLGMTVADWAALIMQKTPGALDMTALVWLARRQAGEAALAFDDVVFPIGSFDVEDVGEDAEPGDADPTPGSSGTPDEPSIESALPPDAAAT